MNLESKLLRPSLSRRLLAAAVALGLALVGAVPVLAACGGGCCAASRATGGQAVLAAPHSCCCGGESGSCDLESAKEPRLPEATLSAAPPVHTPAVVAVSVDPRPILPPQRTRLARGWGPPAQAPPGPLYLRHLALLC